MAYSFQTFSVGQVLTATQMNNVEINIRDHVHGDSGVVGMLRCVDGTSALKIVRNATTSILDVTADIAVLSDGSNNVRRAAVSVSPNAATAGSAANGRDQAGAFTTGAWIYVWLIWNGTTVAGLLSESATAPSLPTGYTYKLRVGAFKLTTGSSTAFNDAVQFGNRHIYANRVQDLDNGAATSATLVVVTVPPVATHALVAMGPGAANFSTGLLNHVTFSGSTTTADTLVKGEGVAADRPYFRGVIQIPLPTAQSIYYAVDGGSMDIFTSGYMMPGLLG